ncbi:hypothetical protein [Microvirga sp.]|uniref:hypothetical protein n=1 Tax=Microvirga sp. TaxID=1873136 RepID=UPI001FEF25CA|nr:hypothetical protein [Microvirga sp.]
MRTPHLKAVSAPQILQVALYARVSSDQQAEHHTIDSQLAELIARAQQDGHAMGRGSRHYLRLHRVHRPGDGTSGEQDESRRVPNACSSYAAAPCWPQRNVVPSIHIRCRITTC